MATKAAVAKTTTSTKQTRSDIIKLLKAGNCTVNFKKSDGTKRTMRCTLKGATVPEGQKLGGDSKTSIKVMDVDANAWRSFRLDAIIGKVKATA